MFALLFFGLFAFLLKIFSAFAFFCYTVPLFIWNYIYYFIAITNFPYIFYGLYLVCSAFIQIINAILYCIFYSIKVITILVSLIGKCVFNTGHPVNTYVGYADAPSKQYTSPLSSITNQKAFGPLLGFMLIIFGLVLHEYFKSDRQVNQWDNQRNDQRHQWQQQQQNEDEEQNFIDDFDFQPRVFRPPLPLPQPQPQPQPRPAANAQANRILAAARPRPFLPPLRPQESPEAAQERRRVLSTFKCPFEVEETVCQKANSTCLFGHARNGNAQALKDLPSYLCTYHLLNSCTSVNPQDCINGLHPAAYSQLLNLAVFERRNRNAIRRYFGGDRNRQCYICQEVVLSKLLAKKRRFAVLENCTHVFCGECLPAWALANYQTNYQLRSPSEVSCPVCRTISRRFIIRRRFTSNEQYKRELFAAV